MSIILPSATLGVVHRLGEIMTPDLKDGVSFFVRGDLMVLRIFKGGEKFYEVEFGETQTEMVAEFSRRGADMIASHGGSGLPPSRVVDPTVVSAGETK